MESALYHGTVRHRRFAPMEHTFQYPLFLAYLDLAEVREHWNRRWWFSNRGFAPVWLRRRDHDGKVVPGLEDQGLEDHVRGLVEGRLGVRPQGPIRLLTHLRYLGFCFNPVSFFYVFEEDGSTLAAVVAEVNNTPWGETHNYVLGAQDSRVRARFSKEFHVSPFLDMEQVYDWRLSAPGERLVTHFRNFRQEEMLFDATMSLRRRPFSGGQLSRLLFRFPFMTQKVLAAIYWQAALLWWKKAPFYAHPKHAETAVARGGTP